MLFLIIFGALILILGTFYAVQQWHEYHEWKVGMLIIIASLCMIGYGVMNWHGLHSNNQQVQNVPASQMPAMNNNKAQQLFSQDDNSNNQENKEMLMLRQMQKMYGKFGTVDYDSKTKTFIISATQKDTKDAMNYLIGHTDQGKKIGWDKITDSALNVSGQLKTQLGPGYSVTINKPDNSGPMYTAKDGVQTFNIAK